MIKDNHVFSYFKTHFRTWRISTSRDSGPGCGDASVPSWWHAAGQDAFLHDEPGHGRHGIFGMLEQSFQRWPREGCIMELVPSGPGASAPGQINRARGPEASSCKLQAGRLKKNTIMN